MTEADELPRLPTSTAGLLGFALRAWAANAPLYLLLQLGVFAAYALAEWLVPAAALSTPQGEFKVFVLIFTGIFADAFVVTAVAMGVAARGADTHAPARALVGVAIDRWLPVIAVSFLVQYLVLITTGLSALGPPAEPRALQYAATPIVWIFWGILGLAAPFVALSANRRPLAVIAGFSHAFSTSLRRGNLLRLCVLALVTVLPMVLQALAFDALVSHHGQRPFFWANVPIDAITIAPVAAIQTAFALDFTRRAADQRPSAP